MLKRLILLVVTVVFFACQFAVGNATAVELDESIRAVKLNEQGEEIVLSLKEVEQGQRLFNSTCSKCHAGGRTKTNPNISLAVTDLAGAVPARDSVTAMVDYLKNPTTYDGAEGITELHPNTQRTDLYPELRNFTEDDLEAVAGYILVQQKVRGIMWGGGKVYN